MNDLATGVSEAVSRIREAELNSVNAALKQGYQVIEIGRTITGVCLLRVEKPDNWTSQNWEHRTYVECIISEVNVKEKVEWVKANYPNAKVSV